MVEKDYDNYILICDICGENEVHDSFDEAVEVKKAEWGTKFEKGQWIDMCPCCKEME